MVLIDTMWLEASLDVVEIAQCGVFTIGGWLGVKDLHKDTCSGRCRRLSHDVLDVFFDGLLCDEERVCDFLVGPSLGQMFHHGLFSIGELELFTGMVGVEILSSPQLFHGDNETSMLDATSIRKAEATEQDWLIWIPGNTLELKLLPVLRFSANMERFDNFSTQLGECRRENAVG